VNRRWPRVRVALLTNRTDRPVNGSNGVSAVILALAVLLPSVSDADPAELIPIQRGHSQTIKFDAPVERVVVTDPGIVQTTQTSVNVVEFLGLKEGQTMIIVWTERSRVIVIATVEKEPQLRQVFVATVEPPKAGGDRSLYGYRGSVFFQERPEGRLEGHQHQVFGYYPTADGRYVGHATVAVDEQQDTSRLTDFLLGYHGRTFRLAGGDVTAEPPPLSSGPSLVRGFSASYDQPRFRLGGYEGLEPGGDDPDALFDSSRAQRFGGFMEYEPADAARFGLHGLRRTGVSGTSGDFDVTQLMPFLRWKPSPALLFAAAGGFNQQGKSLEGRFSYSAPLWRLSSRYWFRGSEFETPDSPREDLSTASLFLRPARLVSVWATATRFAQGAHAFAGTPEASLIRASQSLNVAVFPPSTLDQIRLTFTHRDDDAVPDTADRLLGSERSLSLFLSQRLPSRLGILTFQIRYRDLDRPIDGNVTSFRTRQAEAAWRRTAGRFTSLTLVGFRNLDLGGSFDQVQDRYYLTQEIGLQRGHWFGIANIEIARAITYDRPAATVNWNLVTTGRLQAGWRPTQAHEFRVDAFLTSASGEEGTGEGLLPLNEPTTLEIVLSYAFYFGGAVNAPSLINKLRAEVLTVRAYLDANENGRFDPGEAPVENIPVSVDRGASRLTDRDGNVVVRGLGPGLHRVVADVSGPESSGQSFRFTTASSQLVLMEEGERKVLYLGLSDRSAISGSVFNDANLDGIQQRGESGLSGVQVVLFRGGVVIDRQRTASGHFSFEKVAPGAYRLAIAREGFPPDFEATRTDLDIEAAPSQLVRAAFPVSAIRSIGGVVFLDENGNGLLEEGEPPLANVQIRWNGRVVTSNEEGRYLFRHLPAGEVELRMDPNSLPPDHRPARKRTVLTLPAKPASIDLDLPVVPNPGSN
jgi:hypothetical protein